MDLFFKTNLDRILALVYSYDMNKRILIGIVLVALLIGVYIASGVPQDGGEGEATEQEYVIDGGDFVDSDVLLKDVSPTAGISEVEIAGLLLMREEEKLARDVYTVLGEQWGVAIFGNIAHSEQTHMDAVAVLLAHYGISDPVSENEEIGIFVDPELQQLYGRLVSEGSTSIPAALGVGATIEDLDIFDLERLIGETDKEDIVVTYKNLQKGSRNHLRAFVRQIEQRGGTYKPQYISPDTYKSIIGSTQERGTVQ